MPINVNDPEYTKAEKEYHEATTLEEKLNSLKKMISHAPKHKGGENLRQQLTTRRKKLEQDIVRKKKSGKSTKIGIKKQGHQIVIIGKSNSGKSTLLSLLTNAKTKISEIPFTTTIPTIGMLSIETIAIQLIENPAIDSDFYDKGITNSADNLIIIINDLNEIQELKEIIKKDNKNILVYNNKEEIKPDKIRKIKENLKSKKYNFILINLNIPNEEDINELKNKIFKGFDKIRIYTKEPEKTLEQARKQKPVILEQNSSVKDVAEKILKGFSSKIKQTKIWGPSSKFSGQKIGLNHKLKDLDILEFKTY